MRKQTKIKKTQRSNIYLIILVVCITVLSVKANIVDKIHSESQLDTIAAKELTIKQLNKHINLVSFKLDQAEKNITRLQNDLIILKNALNNKKGKYSFITIDSLSVIRGTNGEIIKIGN